MISRQQIDRRLYYYVDRFICKGPQGLYVSFATSPMSDFGCTWMWALPVSPTLNSGADRF